LDQPVEILSTDWGVLGVLVRLIILAATIWITVVPVVTVTVIVVETAPIRNTIEATVPVVWLVSASKITLTGRVISVVPVVLITVTIITFVAVFKVAMPGEVFTSIGTTTPCFGFRSHCSQEQWKYSNY
jgi:hypothetical protein